MQRGKHASKSIHFALANVRACLAQILRKNYAEPEKPELVLPRLEKRRRPAQLQEATESATSYRRGHPVNVRLINPRPRLPVISMEGRNLPRCEGQGGSVVDCKELYYSRQQHQLGGHTESLANALAEDADAAEEDDVRKKTKQKQDRKEKKLRNESLCVIKRQVDPEPSLASLFTAVSTKASCAVNDYFCFGSGNGNKRGGSKREETPSKRQSAGKVQIRTVPRKLARSMVAPGTLADYSLRGRKLDMILCPISIGAAPRCEAEKGKSQRLQKKPRTSVKQDANIIAGPTVAEEDRPQKKDKSGTNLRIPKEDDDEPIIDDILSEDDNPDPSPVQSVPKDTEGTESNLMPQPAVRITDELTNGITPVNLAEEEKRFFDSGCTANPAFKYDGPQKWRQRVLRLFTRPNGALLPLAEKVLTAFIARYGSETRYLEEFGGDVLSLEETKSVFQRYIDVLGLGSYIALRFSHNTVSPTSIAHSEKNSVITIGLPIEYRRNRIAGVLDHEIGTHFLRKFNDKLQPWHGARKKFRLKKYIATEEGLASLNQLYDSVYLIALKLEGRQRAKHRSRCCSGRRCTTTPAARENPCRSPSCITTWGNTSTTRGGGSRYVCG